MLLLLLCGWNIFPEEHGVGLFHIDGMAVDGERFSAAAAAVASSWPSGVIVIVVVRSICGDATFGRRFELWTMIANI